MTPKISLYLRIDVELAEKAKKLFIVHGIYSVQKLMIRLLENAVDTSIQNDQG